MTDKATKDRKKKKKDNMFVTGLTVQPLQYPFQCGWICPKCGAALSPWTCSCPHCSPIDATPKVTWNPVMQPSDWPPQTTYATGTDKPITTWSPPTSSATTIKSKSQMETLGW